MPDVGFRNLLMVGIRRGRLLACIRGDPHMGLGPLHEPVPGLIADARELALMFVDKGVSQLEQSKYCE